MLPEISAQQPCTEDLVGGRHLLRGGGDCEAGATAPAGHATSKCGRWWVLLNALMSPERDGDQVVLTTPRRTGPSVPPDFRRRKLGLREGQGRVQGHTAPEAARLGFRPRPPGLRGHPTVSPAREARRLGRPVFWESGRSRFWPRWWQEASGTRDSSNRAPKEKGNEKGHGHRAGVFRAGMFRAVAGGAALWGWGRASQGLMLSRLLFYSELAGHVNHPRRLGLAHVSGSRGR